MNVMAKVREQQKKAAQKNAIKQWYNLRPILGMANWALFYILLGGREAGKSYSVTNFFVDQWVNKGIPFVWIRLTAKQANKLLSNNAEKLVDPDIRRKYDLDLVTNGGNVYQVKREARVVNHEDGTTSIKWIIVEKRLMARVFDLSTYYSDKGSIFDKDFLKDGKMWYNIAVDEFQREEGEKNTFDILYALVNQLENIIRSTKQRTRIFFLGNTLEEASDILCAFNFIPESFGIFKLKSKRCVIQNIEPSEEYKKRRKGTVADILLPTASTFTNKIQSDDSLVSKKRPVKPDKIIKFSKNEKRWYTVWDGNLIRPYNGEKVYTIVSMRPYLDELYDDKIKAMYITMFDTRSFVFPNLITFKRFQHEVELVAPRLR